MDVSATPHQKLGFAVMLLSHFERGNIFPHISSRLRIGDGFAVLILLIIHQEAI
jgi:hypothetical protein